MPRILKKIDKKPAQKKSKQRAAAKKSVKQKTVSIFSSKIKYDEVKSLKRWLILVGFLLILGLILSNLYWSQNLKDFSMPCVSIFNKIKEKNISSPEKLNLANPASTNCIELGGEIKNETSPLGDYGVCVFPNGNVCEEWALFREECPDEGVSSEGYRTVLEYYCVITGGAVDNDSKKCIFSDDLSCGLEDYYLGRCRK